jgi:hypothetical protein
METRIYVSDKIRKNYKKLPLNEIPREGEIELHQNSWNANYVAIFGKRCWVVTHLITRYTILIPDIKSDKLQNFRDFFIESMTNQLLKKQYVDPDKIQRFIGDVKFYSTNGDRSCISYINKRIEDLQYWKSEIETFSFDTIGSSLNDIGSKLIDGKSKYIRPTEEILNLIDECS